MDSPSNTEPHDEFLAPEGDGYNPFPLVARAPGWPPRIYATDLTPHIESFGLRATSYLLVPQIGRWECSDRFNPQSPFFQCFFGVYAITKTDGTAPRPEVFADLGLADNRAWLRKMGDPGPMAETESIDYDRQPNRWWKVTARVRIHMDVGPGNPSSGLPPELVVPEEAWLGRVSPYQERIDLLEAIVWTQGRYLFAAWYTGAEFYDASGWRRINTFEAHPDVREGQELMARSVVISDDGGGTRFRRPA